MYRQQEKTLFNPVNEMEKRREKRMRRMEANSKRSKSQVNHKNKVKNTNYKIAVKGKPDHKK